MTKRYILIDNKDIDEFEENQWLNYKSIHCDVNSLFKYIRELQKRNSYFYYEKYKIVVFEIEEGGEINDIYHQELANLINGNIGNPIAKEISKNY